MITKGAQEGFTSTLRFLESNHKLVQLQLMPPQINPDLCIRISRILIALQTIRAILELADSKFRANLSCRRKEEWQDLAKKEVDL